MERKFELIALSLPGVADVSIPAAASRAGGIGVLDLEFDHARRPALEAIEKLSDTIPTEFGVKLNGDETDLLLDVTSQLPVKLRTVILTSRHPLGLDAHIAVLRHKNLAVLLEVTCLEQARIGEELGVHGLIAKGYEAGGRVAEETTFILLQRLLTHVRLPIWAQGGIGLHTAAACAAAGAAGVVLDAQLALTRESPLAGTIKERIGMMDGSETICLGEQLGETYRVYFRPGNQAVKELRQFEKQLAGEDRPPAAILADWRKAIQQRVGWESPERNLLLLGQDAAFAAPLANRFNSVRGVFQGLREAVAAHGRAACQLRPLDEGGPLAKSHGTRYPILQGPMTRVSDVPEFAARVAEGGALPFLALALMRGPEVTTLLTETQHRLGSRPWGVGILGFVPSELRQEQLDAIKSNRPPFVLIAGGRPDQARILEQYGVPTYLHVPSPGLLKMFVQQGARRFIFEGRECGGHVGPRTSFVLWSQMVDVLLDALALDEHPEDYHVVFAAGIHDALSAAMVTVLAAPLAQRGARIGVLLGSAYLFTEEIVSSGAILKGFQEQALRCDRTALLETGPGHATRCVVTPYAEHFEQQKHRLSRSGMSAEDIRLTLEDLNLGRLRIASKGIIRHPKFGTDPKAPKFKKLSKSEQQAQGMYMIGQVAALRSRLCTIETLHREVAVESSQRLPALTEYLWQPTSIRTVEPAYDVAVIGMACLLPKAPDLQTYWENILNKVDAITEVSKDRWDREAYYDPDPKARDKVYSKWGGFLDPVEFDPMQYGMPPASLRSIEPAQLLTLEVVRAALQDAGYSKRDFPRERTAVILGAGGMAALGLAYAARAFLRTLDTLPGLHCSSREILEHAQGIFPEWTEDSFAGTLPNALAGRVANRFDLGGTNCTVDAACASSLAAVSLAVKELEAHASDMAIVGGVDTMQNPLHYLAFSKTYALSPRGRCRTFDESADGIAISEGIAIMVLKRLADAERDGDRIYAVIKSIGSSSDGKEKGLTAPSPDGQVRALRRAYAQADVSPATIGLIEAHGTGTVAGDQAEIQGLTRVFDEAGAQRQSCAIGSVKSMIGHTKCTAGAAGLIKVSLALFHKVLPPTLGVQKPNSNARFPETPFYINTEPRPWMSGVNHTPRRAGVSAFGFGGTNFHVVLEEHTHDPICINSPAYQQWPSELFLWKGVSRRMLLESIERYEQALAHGATAKLCALAYTSWERYQKESSVSGGAHPARLAVVASSLDELKQKLAFARHTLTSSADTRLADPRGIYFTDQPLAQEGKVAFLFPGQGSQYPNMLRHLAIQIREVREHFERADRVLKDRLAQPLSAYVFPPPTFSPEEELERQRALQQTNVAQPAIGTASIAMCRLLESLGVRPDLAAGHSYGEYVALCAAGVFSEDVLVALSEARGRFIVEGAGAEPGVMVAIEAGAQTVAEILNLRDGVQLANVNAPNQTVISGARAAVELAVEQLVAQGLVAKTLPVACAFHSPLVAPAQGRLAEFLSTVELHEPRVELYSNTTASPYPRNTQAIAAQLVEHLVRPVEFVREIEAMYAAGSRIFIEVGPRNVLTNLVTQILRDRDVLAVASDQSGRSGLVQLLHLLSQLVVHGVPVTLATLYQRRSAQKLDLINALQDARSKRDRGNGLWLVDGARANPPSEVSRTANVPPREASIPPQSQPTPRALRRAEDSEVVPTPSNPGSSAQLGSSMAGGSPANPMPVSNALPNAPETPVGEGILEVMAQFQQRMMRFLDTQKDVMLTYLQATSAAGTMGDKRLFQTATDVQPHTTIPSEAQLASEARPAGQGEKPPPLADSASPDLAQAPGLSQEELVGRLLAIVSERTGYPAEMLNLDLDLEADLGIDSIKRVEILGNFQQSLAATGQAHTAGMMEVKTLKGIIDAVVGRLGATTPLPASRRSWPLLGEGAIVARGNQGEVVRKFDPHHDLYLNDHKLDDQPVLPFAVAVELMAEVVAQAWPELEIASLKDVQLLRGVVVRNDAENLRVVATPQPTNGQAPVNVAVEITDAKDPKRIHYRGVVELLERLPDPSGMDSWSLTGGRAFAPDREEVYRSWLFHGPRLQGISAVEEIAADGVTAWLTCSSPQGWLAEPSQAQWIVDPLIVDSGLQLLTLWSREHWDMLTFPFRFHAFRRFATASNSHRQIRCEVRIRPETGGQIIHADLFFYGPDGRTICILEDVEGACGKALGKVP